MNTEYRIVALRGSGRKIHGQWSDRAVGRLDSSRCSSNGGRTQIQGYVIAEGDSATSRITCASCRKALGLEVAA